MARYYLHLRDGTDEVLDEEGMESASLEALKQAVLEGARDVMANELKSGGLIDFRYRIDAENDDQQIVYSLPSRHAANIVPPHA
jgi:myo-inositol catabolism protein IolC